MKKNKISSFSRLALFLGDRENICFTDIKETIVRHLIELSDYFPDSDTRTRNTVCWIVDPFKCAIIPGEPSGFAEAILELRYNTEARIQFDSKQNLWFFWMSEAAKAFKIAHEEAVKTLLPVGYLMNIKTKSLKSRRLYLNCCYFKKSQFWNNCIKHRTWVLQHVKEEWFLFFQFQFLIIHHLYFLTI